MTRKIKKNKNSLGCNKKDIFKRKHMVKLIFYKKKYYKNDVVLLLNITNTLQY